MNERMSLQDNFFVFFFPLERVMLYTQSMLKHTFIKSIYLTHAQNHAVTARRFESNTFNFYYF